MDLLTPIRGIALAALLAACAPSPDPARSPAPDPARSPAPSPAPEDLDLRLDDGFARAAHVHANGDLALVVERPVHLHTRHGRPDRRILLFDSTGAPRGQVEAAPSRTLLDVAVHPSGEGTVLEAGDDGYHLVRIDRAGARLREVLLVDPAIATDPPLLRDGEPSGPIELHTRDTGRLVADGEGLVVATRTGRHSVVAYRVSAALVVEARTLVVPAHAIYPVGLTGGSYDTFGQLDAHYGVHVARDASGVVYVGVQHARVDSLALVEALSSVFGDVVFGDPDGRDLYVTRIAPDGRRLGVVAVGTAEEDQLYGFRATEDGVLLVGRSEIPDETGTGFEALVARVDGKGVASVQRFDVARGDVAFDAVPVAGGVLVVGASAYVQNPHGASISEEATSFAGVLASSATSLHAELASLPASPRQSQVRFAVPLADGRVLVGGMLDGPGTHSADLDPALLRARGFVTVRALPSR